jgi:type II secretory pathway pseudopilin PulG
VSGRKIARPGTRPGSVDEGASLVEVLVALALVSTTMAALGTFFVGGFRSVSNDRGRQAAAQLANSAIEQVRALKGSSLLTGRSPQRSQDQWDSAPAAMQPYLDTMQLASDPLITDPTSTLGDDAAVSTATQSMTVDNASYSRTVYLGQCDVYIGGSGDCVDPSKVAPPADASKDLKFFRAVVLVTWACRNASSGTCTYIASTLMARASEPVFDFHRPSPVVKTTTVTLYKGVAASYQLDASGGQLPNTWTVSSLPPGLTVTPAGVVSGTPTALGTYASMVTVTDKLSRSDTATVTWKVVLPPTLTLPAAPKNYVGDTVNLTVSAANGVAPYTFAAKGLPAGLTLDPGTGAITGTVSTPGASTVSVTVTDSNGGTASGTYTHTVYSTLSLDALADRTTNLLTAFATTATAHGGIGSYTFAASGLPPGVTVNAVTGAVSGIPTVTGRFLPTVTVTDTFGSTASDTFVLIVDSSTALEFTAPAFDKADQSSIVGKAENVDFNTNGGKLKINPGFSATGLPPGLTLDTNTGKVTGKPTTAGTYPVKVTATNLLPPQTSILTLVWTVS